jgi:hypothetical protein
MGGDSVSVSRVPSSGKVGLSALLVLNETSSSVNISTDTLVQRLHSINPACINSIVTTAFRFSPSFSVTKLLTTKTA